MINIDEKKDIKIEILLPDKTKHAEMGLEFIALSPTDVVSMILDMSEFPLPVKGTYAINILVDNNIIGEYNLEVTYPPERKFLPEEIEEILNDPNRIKGSIVTFECKKCNKKMIFELNLDSQKPIESGHIKFPDNNLVECCGETTDLTGLRREIEWAFGSPKQIIKEA
jgi:hypothetical protein